MGPLKTGKFSSEEQQFIRDNFRTLSDPEMGKALNRAEYNITNWRTRNKLKKPDEMRLKTSFKKGIVPFNKGVKVEEWMTPDKIEKVKASQFGKGHLPQNTLHDGVVTIRKDSRGVLYKYIRIGLANWKRLQQYNWEIKNGPVPKGMLLRSKDGDTLNCDPDNWELIDRTQNVKLNLNRGKALLNGPFYNLSNNYVAHLITMKQPHLKEKVKQMPELIELARANYHLKRAIKNETNREAK